MNELEQSLWLGLAFVTTLGTLIVFAWQWWRHRDRDSDTENDAEND